MFGVWFFSGFKEFSAFVGDDAALGVSRVHVAVARRTDPPSGVLRSPRNWLRRPAKLRPLWGSASPTAAERPPSVPRPRLSCGGGHAPWQASRQPDWRSRRGRRRSVATPPGTFPPPS